MKCAVVFLNNVPFDESDGNVRTEPNLLKENLTFGSPYEVTSKVRGYEALDISTFYLLFVDNSGYRNSETFSSICH